MEDPSPDRHERRALRRGAAARAPGELDEETLARLPELHAEAYSRHYPGVRPLNGSTELLARLDHEGIPWAIATSGAERTAGKAPALLGLPEDTPMVTRDLVRDAKPDPDLFVTAAA